MAFYSSTGHHSAHICNGTSVTQKDTTCTVLISESKGEKQHNNVSFLLKIMWLNIGLKTT